jgi:hypothetical protein
VFQQPLAQCINSDEATGPDLQALQVSAGDRVINRGAANSRKAAGFGRRHRKYLRIRAYGRVRFPHFFSNFIRFKANEGKRADKWLLKKGCSISSSFQQPTLSSEISNPVEE